MRVSPSSFAEEGAEAGLNEMAIDGERFPESPLFHHGHGDAIDHGPFFIRTPIEKDKTLMKQAL